jgi:hypothetical protein
MSSRIGALGSSAGGSSAGPCSGFPILSHLPQWPRRCALTAPTARPTLFATLHPHHTPMLRTIGNDVAWCGEGVAETAPSPREPACGCVAREGTMGALACVLKSDNAEDIGVAVGLRVRARGPVTTLSMPIAISISDSACSLGGAGDSRVCVYTLTCSCGHACTPPRPRSPHATNHA